MAAAQRGGGGGAAGRRRRRSGEAARRRRRAVRFKRGETWPRPGRGLAEAWPRCGRGVAEALVAGDTPAAAPPRVRPLGCRPLAGPASPAARAPPPPASRLAASAEARCGLESREAAARPERLGARTPLALVLDLRGVVSLDLHDRGDAGAQVGVLLRQLRRGGLELRLRDQPRSAEINRGQPGSAEIVALWMRVRAKCARAGRAGREWRRGLHARERRLGDR